MSKEFPLLHKRLEKLKNLHTTALVSFNVYEALNKLRAPNIIGQDEAKANVNAIGRYKGLFNTAERGVLLNTLVCLSKIFVAHKDSLYLEKLVNFAEQNKSRLSADDFKEFHADRQYIDELVKEYNGLCQEDVQSIREDFARAQDSINRLKVIRDQQLAHTNLKDPDDTAMKFQEIADLIALSEKVLNILSTKHFKNLMVFDVMRDQVETDTIGLVHLARLENEHSREVGELMEKYGNDYITDLSLK